MQIKGGTAAVGGFCFEGNDAMTQFQFELKFPTAELTFWWPEISWKPSSSNCRVDILVARNFLETIQFGCAVGPPFWARKNCFLNGFTKTKSDKKQTVVFVDIPYVIGCRDMCVDREGRAWFGELS